MTDKDLKNFIRFALDEKDTADELYKTSLRQDPKGNKENSKDIHDYAKAWKTVYGGLLLVQLLSGKSKLNKIEEAE